MRGSLWSKRAERKPEYVSASCRPCGACLVGTSLPIATCDNMCRRFVSFIFVKLLSQVSCVFWIAGFILHSMWLVMKAGQLGCESYLSQVNSDG